MSEEYLNTVRRLEPEITPIDDCYAQGSIAISLKRIADNLDDLWRLADVAATVADKEGERIPGPLLAFIRQRAQR
jgi:hypothetical protein